MDKPLPSPEEAIRILHEVGCPDDVIKHCEAVARLAVRTAKKCLKNGVNVNVQLIHIGALLHDIGRSKTHRVHHAIVGAEIARSLDLPEPIISIIERHVGGGISSDEAAKLGWPRGNYMPETIEEKIVSYADKLIEGTRIVTIEETLRKFRIDLGDDHPAIERIKRLHSEISTLCSPNINLKKQEIFQIKKC
ncbi:MAG: TIGR00295 family protein [Candidatus Bathyarchaeia archaeon]|nr:TIGR00295 family protein [Candidatus Bathyarchaeota archaeon]